jgi:alkanesulfonate monooxygenase SsuD/methylene tetrahydromethanopterin reductase-like flavin-dependent oxidoreductase (luciferase family)
MIETWGFFAFVATDEVDAPEKITRAQYQQSFDEALDLWEKCEAWGLDGLAWAEHHFGMLGLAPSPHLCIASVAARTKRLKFTVAGSVLPLHDGRRHAEECGMLAYMTRGRFEPGIAPGAGVSEAVKAGFAAEDVRARYYSAAEFLEKALRGPFVTQKDKFTNVENLPIVPPPHLSEGQGVWVTVMSPDSAAWTAQRGYKLMTGWMPTGAAAGLAARYYAAADEAGRPANPKMLALRRRVFVADTDAEAEEKRAAASDLMLKYAGQAFESADPKVLAMISHPDDYAVGSPETVAEKLVEQCRAGGYGSLMAFTDFAAFDRKSTLRCHELLGTRVAPLLQKADISRPTGMSAATAAALKEAEDRRAHSHAMQKAAQ